jgi:hypothetical protein
LACHEPNLDLVDVGTDRGRRLTQSGNWHPKLRSPAGYGFVIMKARSAYRGSTLRASARLEMDAPVYEDAD